MGASTYYPFPIIQRIRHSHDPGPDGLGQLRPGGHRAPQIGVTFHWSPTVHCSSRRKVTDNHSIRRHANSVREGLR
jgi:hypothetical protein